jgi:hypothetical protein
MPIMNQAPQLYVENVASSYTMTELSGPAADGIVYFGNFYPGPYSGFAIRVDRESETGTCTLDFKLQTYDETTGDYTDWLDGAGTANLVLPQWGNGSAVVKWMKVHPQALASDADNVLVVDTANRIYNEIWWAPFRMVVTTGGTGVTNVVSISLTYVP